MGAGVTAAITGRPLTLLVCAGVGAVGWTAATWPALPRWLAAVARGLAAEVRRERAWRRHARR